jgi:phosphoribosylformylglycinamidine cyclo-ligase
MYEKLGVDPSKKSVRAAFESIVGKVDFPQAFVKIKPSPFRRGMKATKHSDGSGSKIIQRVLHFLEMGDSEIFRYDPFDAFSMNYSDVAASGFLGPYATTDTVGINAQNVPKSIVLRELAIGMAMLKELYLRHGIKIVFFGGETADLPDQIATYVLDADVYAETALRNIVAGNVRSGDLVFGLSSAGQAKWEEVPNFGPMSNGYTLGRYGLMHRKYTRKYPFLCRRGKRFSGRFLVDDKVPELGGATVSEALLSPTRQWAIVIKMLVEELEKLSARHLLHGLVINTGGGASKCLHIGKGITYTKHMPKAPPLFQLIQSETGESWENMLTTFNCGIGVDVIGAPDCQQRLKAALNAVTCRSGVEYYKLGDCKKSNDGKNRVIIEMEGDAWMYD